MTAAAKQGAESHHQRDPAAVRAEQQPLVQPPQPKKGPSFQITSVTRVSTDAGDDSADDLDESHTESRATDLETPSFSEDASFSRDEIFTAFGQTGTASAPVIPTSAQYGLALVGPANADGPHEAKEADHKDQPCKNDRFKVVKIESTEPFKRGRWTCMDFLDHNMAPAAAPEEPPPAPEEAEVEAATRVPPQHLQEAVRSTPPPPQQFVKPLQQPTFVQKPQGYVAKPQAFQPQPQQPQPMQGYVPQPMSQPSSFASNPMQPLVQQPQPVQQQQQPPQQSFSSNSSSSRSSNSAAAAQQQQPQVAQKAINVLVGLSTSCAARTQQASSSFICPPSRPRKQPKFTQQQQPPPPNGCGTSSSRRRSPTRRPISRFDGTAVAAACRLPAALTSAQGCSRRCSAADPRYAACRGCSRSSRESSRSSRRSNSNSRNQQQQPQIQQQQPPQQPQIQPQQPKPLANGPSAPYPYVNGPLNGPTHHEEQPQQPQEAAAAAAAVAAIAPQELLTSEELQANHADESESAKTSKWVANLVPFREVARGYFGATPTRAELSVLSRKVGDRA
ncbi:Hypothetical predicted protein [Cloeon dipterum]|uniref:Uncharacterized protein n=1 Tax=Cloeon dipterum TaxID=197152 RepID=A0A8S1DK50_9INSE|nr:Hypothetical predicted protein [Cloeon dipterum]